MTAIVNRMEGFGMDLDDIALPAGTHGALATGTDIVTGARLAYPVVWADRPYDTCPGCGASITVEVDCPVILNTGACQGGQLQEFSKEHHCGFCLTVPWQEVTAPAQRDEDEDQDGNEVVPGIGEDDVLAVARKLAADRQQQITELRETIEAGLRDELTAALARLAEPLEDGETSEDRAAEITTGSEVHPGVYNDGSEVEPGVYTDGEWIAWAYDPVGAGPITAYASALSASHHD